MSEKMRFFKSGILLTLVGLAMRTAGMFFGAFISRTVGAEGTGLYTLIMTVYSFAITFATSGVSLTVTRLVASAIGEGNDSEVGRIMRGAIIYSSLFGVVGTTSLYLLSDFIGTAILSDARTVAALKILSLSLLPVALSAVFAGYFVGVKRVAFNAVTSVVCQIIKMIFTVYLVIYLSAKGIVYAVMGLCIGITVTELFGFLLILLEYIYDRNRHCVVGKNNTPRISPVARMALPLALSAYFRSLLLNVEHILIPKKLRESGESASESYAHYGTLHGMALPLIIYPMSPLSSFAGLLVPEFAEDMSAGRCKRMSRVASLALNSTLAYATVCSVFLFAFAEDLGFAIYKSYDAGYYISLLSFVIPIMYLDHVTDSALKGIGEQVFSMWVNIFDSLLSVILVWVLIPRMGIMGYALVIVIMEGFNFTLSFFRLKRKIAFDIHPMKSVLPPLVASAVSVILTDSVFRFGGSSVSIIWVALKMIFALAITVFLLAIITIFAEKQKNKSALEQRKTA